ncbi:MAG: tRNA pseudouridine(55) synthase TruB [Kofleriaceae bacterium]|nr:tRNA pseudouridine(55) synthase TruB [Myxococcales bacterium]MCB9573191.1 tRNA pseudouridine(55) synthase TruB [Kofleriaceae bacterium]
MTPRDEPCGVLVVDKPAGITSAGVVEQIRRCLHGARAGHTGTLDPLATGVLPVCIGEATKLAGHLIALDKGYEAELELGAETDTLDATGAITAEDRAGVAAVDEDALRAGLAAFTGDLDQVPPLYSAVKIGGRRVHQRVRDGEQVELAPRRITVHRFALVDYRPPRARVEVACSKGTYVRSLVRDLGRALGPGAHLTALRRTRSGQFDLGGAIPLDEVSPARIRARLIRPADALALPRVTVPPVLWRAVRDGAPRPFEHVVADTEEGAQFQMVTEDGDLLAVCTRVRGLPRFDRVFVYAVDAGA